MATAQRFADEGADVVLVDVALDAAERVAGLVNNAGITLNAPLLEISVPQWDQVLAVHLRGTFLATGHAAPVMGGTGAIVDIASVAALMAVPQTAAYSAAKGGVVASPGSRASSAPASG